MRALTLAALSLALVAGSVQAAPACRDGKGKFIKCAAAAAKAPVRCKDAKGKFAKCGAAGAKPA